MTKTKHDIKKLPKWAQRHISELEDRVKHAEATIPWTEPGMEWFTIGVGVRRPIRLFTLHETGSHCICVIGKNDRLFIGRGKKNQLSGKSG